jgi:hypothetical protein
MKWFGNAWDIDFIRLHDIHVESKIKHQRRSVETTPRSKYAHKK